jgi:hypothetical protein
MLILLFMSYFLFMLSTGMGGVLQYWSLVKISEVR